MVLLFFLSLTTKIIIYCALNIQFFTGFSTVLSSACIQRKGYFR